MWQKKVEDLPDLGCQTIYLSGCAEEYVNSNAFRLESAQVLPTPEGIRVLCLFYVDEKEGGGYNE